MPRVSRRKKKIDALTIPEVNACVALLLGFSGIFINGDRVQSPDPDGQTAFEVHGYAESWSQGGAVISLLLQDNDLKLSRLQDGRVLCDIYPRDLKLFWYFHAGQNELDALMRCFVHSRLGETVDLGFLKRRSN